MTNLPAVPPPPPPPEVLPLRLRLRATTALKRKAQTW